MVFMLLESNDVILIHRRWNGNYLNAMLQSLNSAIFSTFFQLSYLV